MVIKIEAGSEVAVLAPSLEPGDSGTACPGSRVVTHSWELGMEPCESLPASLGSLLTLLDPLPSSLNARPAQSQESYGQKLQSCWQGEGGKKLLRVGSGT